MNDINQQIFVAFDFETTGLDPYSGDRIIEIAAVPVYNKKIKFRYSFNTLVNPEVKIPGEVSRFHKLNNSDISKAPTLSEVFDSFRNYLSNSILISHNITMDLKFMDVAAKEVGYFPINYLYIDTLELSRYFLDEKSYKLEYLSRKYLPGTERFHRAWDDAVATARLFLWFTEKYSLKSVSDFIKKWG